MRLTKNEERCLVNYLIEQLNIKTEWSIIPAGNFHGLQLDNGEINLERKWYFRGGHWWVLNSPTSYTYFRFWNEYKLKRAADKLLEQLNKTLDLKVLNLKRKSIKHILDKCDSQ